MQFLDYSIVFVYLIAILLIGFYGRLRKDASTSEMILGGRMLTLPAFVASLVSTWYGGILGVGEYSYRFGISNWLVFGLPYYLAALFFALFLAKKARESGLLTIPERLSQTYDRRTALTGSLIIFLMTIPAAYILMLGVLGEQLLGLSFSTGVLLGSLFSVVYVFAGGFRSVVRTDIVQFGLMFVGFAVLLVILVSRYGGADFLSANLPAEHLTWHGGNSGWYIAVWYVIALATLVEPSFYQRCYAAKSPAVARKGIFISIGCWALFDFMTTTSGLYARVLLPNLTDPVSSFPALAQMVLPVGLLGLFALTLLATVMSTVDSYAFLAASTFGNDILGQLFKGDNKSIRRYTNVGLLLATSLAALFAIFFRSAVDIWHAFGSIGTPALLVPLFFSFVGKRKLPAGHAFFSMVSVLVLSLVWYLSPNFTAGGEYWLSLEPIFPGLFVSLVIYFLYARQES
ncbi:MAG: sodium:solute symporter family protein [bacterium]|nr:sodium:solute symporter family protein [bacterium]